MEGYYRQNSNRHVYGQCASYRIQNRIRSIECRTR